MKTSAWKRYAKELDKDGRTVRIFDCTPFEGQLRADAVEVPGGLDLCIHRE